MKSTPLLMKGPLVRATLAGVKTETRRLITSLNGIGKLGSFHPPLLRNGWSFRKKADFPEAWHVETLSEILARCPYGAPGDRLWVRETWQQELTGHYIYRADTSSMPGDSWQPSIFMPREACRLELELDSVSIEFVQDITDAAIRAEGVADLTLDDLREFGITAQKINRILSYAYASTLHDWNNLTLIQRWRVLWDAINGHRPGASWSANPPVWALKYRKVTT